MPRESAIDVVFGVRCKRQMIHFETPKGRRLIYTHKLCLQFLTDVVYSFVSQVMNVVRAVAFKRTKAALDKKQTYSWRNAILIKISYKRSKTCRMKWEKNTFLNLKKKKTSLTLNGEDRHFLSDINKSSTSQALYVSYTFIFTHKT